MRFFNRDKPRKLPPTTIIAHPSSTNKLLSSSSSPLSCMPTHLLCIFSSLMFDFYRRSHKFVYIKLHFLFSVQLISSVSLDCFIEVFFLCTILCWLIKSTYIFFVVRFLNIPKIIFQKSFWSFLIFAYNVLCSWIFTSCLRIPAL